MFEIDERTVQKLKSELFGIHVLMLEDEEIFSTGTIELLLSYGIAKVDLFVTGETARDAAIRHRYDMLLLDRDNPGMDGLTALRAIRKSGSGSHEAPVLMVTRLGATAERFAGYTSGADDYITKPVEGIELLARMASKIRRGSNDMPAPIDGDLVNGPLVVNERLELATFFGDKIDKLTPKTFSILCALMRVRGLPLTNSMLFRRCWPSWNVPPEGWENTVFKQIQHVRLALEPFEASLPANIRPILINIRGQGYRLRDLSSLPESTR